MDEVQQPIQQTPETKLPPQQTPPSIHPRNWYKYGFFGLIFLLIIAFIYFFLSSGGNLDHTYMTIPTVTNKPTSIDSNKIFNDPRLEDMSFSYNPASWTVRQFNYNDEEITKKYRTALPGIIARQPNDRGTLLILYTPELAMGGGISLLESGGDAINISNTIARVKVQNDYLYGAQKNIVFFVHSPDELKELLKICAEGPNPVLDETSCQQLQSQDAIGYIEQPTYSFSIRLKRTVPIKDFGWDESLNPDNDNGLMITDIRYQGIYPEGADEIVKQIVKNQL